MNDSLPGNPHHYEAHMDAPSGHYQVAQATLALAFEQRTATLVAIGRAFGEYGQRELGAPFIQEAGDRLGFEADS